MKNVYRNQTERMAYTPSCELTDIKKKI